jgi:hypothetical protein
MMKFGKSFFTFSGISGFGNGEFPVVGKIHYVFNPQT